MILYLILLLLFIYFSIKYVYKEEFNPNFSDYTTIDRIKMDDTYVNKKKRLYSSKLKKHKKYTQKKFNANIKNALDLQSGGGEYTSLEEAIKEQLEKNEN